MGTSNILHVIACELGRALSPLRDAIGSPDAFESFMLELGWTAEDIPPPIQALGTALDRLEAAIAPVTAGDPGPDDFVELLGAVRGLVDEIRALQSATFDPQLALAGFAATFPKQVVEYLIVRHLLYHHPRVAFLLTTLGVIRVTYVEAASDDHRDHLRRNLAWVDFSQLLRDPTQLLENAFGWRTEHLAHELLLGAATNLALSSGLQASFDEMKSKVVRRLENDVPMPGEPMRLAANLILFERPGEGEGEVLSAGLKLMGLPADGALLPGFALMPYVLGQLAEGFELDPRWTLTVNSSLDLRGGVGVVLRPGTGLQILVGLNEPSSGTAAEGNIIAKLVNRDQSGDPIVLLGSADGSRLEYKSLSVNAGLVLKGDEQDLFAELVLAAAKLVIKAGEGDSFLRKILPADGITADFELTPGYSRRRGIYFSGSAGLELDIPAHYSLGPIDLHGIKVAVRPDADNSTIPVHLGATLVTKLGPLTAVVDNIGLKAIFSFPDDSSGVLGPLDINIGFKPPDGIGLVVDAGRITGGGFLYHNADTGRYVGALELEVYDVAIKAIGILDTRLPGGDPPYSFLIMVTVEFWPIALGFGFMLTGVGGLAGIHRRLAADVFRERLKQGAIEHILFPANPIEDITEIISDLSAVIPPAADRYVFGPMAKFTWGPTAIVEGKLGILLELPMPVRLILLGQFNIALPKRDVALILLNLDMVGEIDPARLLIALDGRMVDSKVVGMPIEGEFAARLIGGSDPIFAMSAGGFHPSYTPPAGFPTLKRITIPAGIDDNPRITLEGYLAQTSNTLQVGALATVYASAGLFSISGHVGFDAIITIIPFSFITDFSGKVALKKGETVIAAISLEARLSGPSPWRVAGEATLEIRWLPDISVGVHATFGVEVHLPLPILDPFALLRAAAESLESWSGERPAGLFRTATTAPAGAMSQLFDPAEGVTLRQSVVPLARQVTRFGAAQPQGGSVRYDVETVTLGTAGAPWTPVEDLFAPAQFEDLSDAEKLSRPDFERMGAGLSIAREAVAHGQSITAAVTFETRIIDSPIASRPAADYQPTRDFQLAAAAMSAAAMSPLRRTGPTKFSLPPAARPRVSLGEDHFVVVSTTDLSERRDIVPPTGKGAAFQALAAHLSSHPEDRGRLEVVSIDELATVGSTDA